MMSGFSCDSAVDSSSAEHSALEGELASPGTARSNALAEDDPLEDNQEEVCARLDISIFA